MNFPELSALLPIATRDNLIGFWLAAIEYRKTHQVSDYNLAHYVFVATLEVGGREPWYDIELDQLCSEFGALEAPGWPPGWPDDQSIEPEDYVDSLWTRLEEMVKKISVK
ncbi:hypothetical protein [Streptomyces sp. SM11]|uniref:hypothetical protein n=1 Tax=Streptomyces sp. SM11 TaxID=565557 RepID=UPI0011B0717D|nr:hypothetical protein [Streptomyces sp. SM11]